jgi:hypothetical protein
MSERREKSDHPYLCLFNFSVAHRRGERQESNIVSEPEIPPRKPLLENIRSICDTIAREAHGFEKA